MNECFSEHDDDMGLFTVGATEWSELGPERADDQELKK
jgi:hypothetical protein